MKVTEIQTLVQDKRFKQEFIERTMEIAPLVQVVHFSTGHQKEPEQNSSFGIRQKLIKSDAVPENGTQEFVESFQKDCLEDCLSYVRTRKEEILAAKKDQLGFVAIVLSTVGPFCTVVRQYHGSVPILGCQMMIGVKFIPYS